MVINIKKFYKRSVNEILMFGYINAFRLNFPAVTLDSAIKNFIKHHAIDEDGHKTSLETISTTYYRMEKEYAEVLSEAAEEKKQTKSVKA